MSRLPSRPHFRDTHHHAVAVGSEILAPALRLVAKRLSRGPASDPATWRRALIVGHGHIGDVLCQTVSLDALVRGLPECSFDYLTTPLAATVLTGNPALDKVFPWNSGTSPTALSEAHFNALGAIAYDAILCTNVVRHHEALRLALKLHIPNRVAFVHRGLSGLVTLPVRLPHPMTPAAQSRVMAEAITGQRDPSELRPRVFRSKADIAEGEAEWQRLDLQADESTVACAVTTRQQIGKIPSDFYSEVLRLLQERAPQVRIVLTGSAADSPILKSIAKSLGPRVAVSAGTLSLLGFASFLSRCNVLFCMDSGPRHIANAVGTPVVFTRNLAVRAAEAGAYCATEVDLMPAADFLTQAQAARVLESVDMAHAVQTILQHSGPTP